MGKFVRTSFPGLMCKKLITGLILLLIVFNYQIDNTLPKIHDCSNECYYLAEVGYFEARGEGDRGMLAVMSVVNARAEHPSKRWPESIESVVKQRCEFSYRCDGSMKKKKEPLQWTRAKELAWWYVNNRYDAGFDAQYYHRDGISKIPRWSKTEKRVGKVGNHIFFSCASKYC